MIERLRPVLTRNMLLSIAAAAVGVAMLAFAEFWPMHELRVFGATLIAGGGTAIGIVTGLADPRALRVPDALRWWRVGLGVAAALLIALPVVAVLVAALVGMAGDTAETRDGATLAAGAALSLLMLAGTAAVVVASARAIVRAGARRELGNREQ